MDKNKRGRKSESIKLRKIFKKTKIIPGMNKKNCKVSKGQ